MQTESAPEAQLVTHARTPSGLRRLSLAMLATEKLAEGFQGLSPESAPGRVLAAFKAAAPVLGYGPRVIQAIDWLFSFTQPQDWAAGARPIIWPSASLQQHALGLGDSQTKCLNRQLVELGLMAMKDSPNGKRYGKRDGAGRIVEAYGFDLSPLAARLAEFQAVAERARAEREEMRHLRRRATIARKGLDQVLETADELGLMDAPWRRLAEEARALARSLRNVERPEEMALGVASLERRHREAREWLESATAKAADIAGETVNSDPKGPEIRPHQYTYNRFPDLEKDTVMASEGSSPVANFGAQRALSERAEKSGSGKGPEARPRTDSGTVLRMSPEELVRLAPRLKSYLSTPSPAWPEIVDAADWLRHDLGVSKSLWGEACLAMGREQAALALAIVSAKPADHFTSSPGGYFHGMVHRAKAGTLYLGRTVWGLRGRESSRVRQADQRESVAKDRPT